MVFVKDLPALEVSSFLMETQTKERMEVNRSYRTPTYDRFWKLNYVKS